MELHVLKRQVLGVDVRRLIAEPVGSLPGSAADEPVQHVAELVGQELHATLQHHRVSQDGFKSKMSTQAGKR